MSGREDEIAIRQCPEFVAARRRMLPLHFAVGAHDEDFALGVIRAGETMLRERPRSEVQQQASAKTQAMRVWLKTALPVSVGIRFKHDMT